MDKERKFRAMCFKFRKSHEVREEILARTLDIPRPWRRNEMGRNSEGKWDSTATQMVERLNETSHPVFKSISAFESWNSEENKRDTVHFNADSSNRTLVSHNSLSKSAQYLRSSLKLGVLSSVKGRMRKSRLRSSF